MEILHKLESMLPIICLVLGAVGLLILITIPLLKLLDLRRLFKQKWTFLELTPPAAISRSPEATQQLFVNLYGLNRSRGFISKILFQKMVFTQECQFWNQTLEEHLHLDIVQELPEIRSILMTIQMSAKSLAGLP